MVAAVVALLAVSGCSVIPKPSSVALYELPAPTLASRNEPLPWHLRITTPATSDALAGTRLLIKEDGNELSSYGGARWVSPVPELLRDRLADAFLEAGAVNVVITDRANLGADRELSGALRSFYTVVENGAAEAVIRFDATLADAKSREVLATKRFTVRELLTGSGPRATVAAFGPATDRLAEELVNWMASSHSK